MLRIERIRLHLSSEYEARAEGIARAIAEHLEALEMKNSLRRENLILPRLSVSPSMSDAEIGKKIARNFSRNISE